MVNNCLVTKLRGVVDNDTLPVYGMFDMFVAQTSNNERALHFTKSCSVEVKGGTINGQTTVSTNNWGYVALDKTANIVPDGTYGNKVKIVGPKYTIDQLVGPIDEINAMDYEYAPIVKLRAVKVNNAKYIEKLFTKDTLNYLELQYSDIDEPIDLTNFGSSKSIVGFQLGSASETNKYTGSLNKLGLSNISGGRAWLFPSSPLVSFEVEQFVAYNRSEGRSTGAVKFAWMGTSNSTFNNHRIENKAEVNISWTATTITVDGETIDA